MLVADRSSGVLACGESGSTWSARAPSDVTAPVLGGAPVSTLLTTAAWRTPGAAWRTPGAGVGGPRIVGLPAVWVTSVESEAGARTTGPRGGGGGGGAAAPSRGGSTSMWSTAASVRMLMLRMFGRGDVSCRLEGMPTGRVIVEERGQSGPCPLAPGSGAQISRDDGVVIRALLVADSRLSGAYSLGVDA